MGYTNGFTYDNYGNLLTSTDGRGNSSTNFYDAANGNLIASTDSLGHGTTNFYNGGSLLLGSVDAIGTCTTNYYDAAENLTGTATVSGSTILATNTFAYDLNGNRTNSTVWRRLGSSWVGAQTTYIYDAQNRVTQTIDPDGGTNTVVYNEIGRQAATIDKLGRTTSFEYDAQGRMFRTTYPDLTTESSVYDSAGNRTTSVDRGGRTNIFVYDSLNRVTNTIYADNTTNTTVYDGVGRVARTIDARGAVTAFSYDLAGRRIAVTNALSTSVASTNFFGYDANGNHLYFTNALGAVTTNVFDTLNRQWQTQFPDGTKTSTRFDVGGRRVAETNQDGIVTLYGYDGAGRLVAVTNALGTASQTVTRYEHDEAGNQTAQIDALNRTNRFEYDSLGRRTKRTLPGNQSETFGYNVLGNLIAHTNFNGTIITNQFDGMGRLWKRWNSGTELETYLYSVTGRLTNRTDASGTHTWVYDGRDRLRTNTTPAGTLAYTYDANGNQLSLSSTTANGVDLSYEYDALNRLTNAVDNRHTGAKNTGYTFDCIGNLAKLKYPNWVTNLWQYDSLNRLTNLTWKLNGAARGEFSYKLGTGGQRTNLSEMVDSVSRVFSWQFDKLYRLTNEIVTGTAPTGNLGYGYDLVGNRTNRSGSLGALGSQALNYSTNDWVDNDTNPGNGSTYFDANGNTTNLDGTWQYDWANRLTNFNSGTATYVYDANGNRIMKTASGVTTWYLVATVNPSGWSHVVEEHMGSSPATVTRRYTYGLELISQSRWTGSVWDTHFFLTDGLGSTRALLNSSGNISDTYVYDAYGTLLTSTGTTPNAYRYTGEQWDENLGLYYLRARYYQPQLGRFWTMDNFEGSQSDPLSLHKYLYCHGDGINYSDPSGHYEALGGLIISTAIKATLGALTGAAIGGAAGGIDAALDSDPNRTFWDGAGEGAMFGLVVGGFLPFATPALVAGVGVVGTGAGVVGTIQSGAEGNWGQAAFRGVTTVAGGAGFRQIGLWDKANRLKLIELIKTRGRTMALSADAERGAQPNYLQGLGLMRTEQAFGTTVSTASELGVDGVASGLGKIQLKGPFLRRSDLKLLSASQRQTGIQDTLSSISQNTAYETLVIDTLGLTQAEITQLESAIANMNSRKPVYFLK